MLIYRQRIRPWAKLGGVKKFMSLFMEAETLSEMDHKSPATIAKLGLSSTLPRTEMIFNYRDVICTSNANLMERC